MSKQTYLVTAKAGRRVAGQVVPGEELNGQWQPRVGHALELTALEAEYELRERTIIPQSAASFGDPPTAAEPLKAPSAKRGSKAD
ncbi:MAG: hypothetical protein KF895_15290 [Parvibaculum sp.]|uniref:hypothetical protein n=1 Tax=Chelatococcus sp. TaxID=1953771 RepID=UPI001EC795A0|nr:hypothetical protein [Chelatococcus sp.]MBX3506843.1 hypothetical protein [Parvibaculum sp.]MBX3545590.1 hypothetical protein [Chelatococcus sp.]